MATNEQIQIIIKAMASQAISELEKVNKGLATTESQSKKTSSGLGDLSGLMMKAAGAAGALYTVYRTLIKPASDLEEQTNKFNVVFRDQSAAANEAATVLSRSYGLSERAAREYMSTLGSMLKSMGMTSQQTVRMSASMTQLAVDMSSFHNVDTAEVMAAFRSAISGEFEPMKRFGVLLNETTVKAEALRIGMYRGTGEINAQARAIASMNIITRSQRDAIGDFARTSDGFANQMRIASANIEDVSAKLGTLLMPAAKSAISSFNTLILGVGVLAERMGLLASSSTTTGGVLGWLAGVMGTQFRAMIAASTFGLSEFLMRLGSAREEARRWQTEGGGSGRNVLSNISGGFGRGIVGLAAANQRQTIPGPGGGANAATERLRTERENHDRLVTATMEMTDRINGTYEASYARLDAQRSKDIENATKHGADLAEVHAYYALQIDMLNEENHQKQLQRLNDGLSFAGSSWGQMGNIVSQYFKNQSLNLDNWYKKQKASISNSTKDEETKKTELAALDELYAKKQRDAAIKQAKYEKANAIMSAIINTSIAVTSALARSGPPWIGIAMASVVGALGAAQIAMIANQPIPEAAEGGLITGSQAGTLLRAGEGGRSEAIIPLENSAAMDKIGALGSTVVNIHFDRMWASTSMPQDVASAVDKALYDLKRRGNSRFATAIEG